MPKLPRVKPIKIIKALKRAGFYIDHVTSSHYILYKDDKSPPVSVPKTQQRFKNRHLKKRFKTSQIISGRIY